jgi:Putative prokaryotic signal transducing protein
MFCPKCRYEYDFGIAVCPDCEVRLVAELPPEDETEYVDLVTVLTTGDAGVAAMAKSILEAAEIEYFVKGESTRALFAAGFIEIQVRPDDVEDARQLLDDMKRDLKATDPRRSEMEDEEDDYEGEEGDEKD